MREMNAKELQQALLDFERELRSKGEKETRQKWRDGMALVYVKKHTIQAYFRPYRRRRVSVARRRGVV